MDINSRINKFLAICIFSLFKFQLKYSKKQLINRFTKINCYFFFCFFIFLLRAIEKTSRDILLNSDVDHFILTTFPSSAYFSCVGIKSIILSSKMVSDFTSKSFLSSTYFSHFDIKSTTITRKMVSVFILGSFFSLVNLGIIEDL